MHSLQHTSLHPCSSFGMHLYWCIAQLGVTQPLRQLLFVLRRYEGLSMWQHYVCSKGQALQKPCCSCQVSAPLPTALPLGHQQPALPLRPYHCIQIVSQLGLQSGQLIWLHLANLLYHFLQHGRWSIKPSDQQIGYQDKCIQKSTLEEMTRSRS